MKPNLKMNKKAALIVGAAIFVIAIGVLGMMTFQKTNEKSLLEKQLKTSQTKLQSIKIETISSQPVDIQNQLEELSENITQLKAKLSQPITSTNATAAVFDAAKNNSLMVSEIKSSGPTNETIQGVNLSAISINAKVEGKLSKMVNFIAELNSRMKPSAIKSVEIIVPELTTSSNSTASNTDNTTANIELVIYAYRGE